MGHIANTLACHNKCNSCIQFASSLPSPLLLPTCPYAAQHTKLPEIPHLQKPPSPCRSASQPTENRSLHLGTYHVPCAHASQPLAVQSPLSVTATIAATPPALQMQHGT